MGSQALDGSIWLTGLRGSLVLFVVAAGMGCTSLQLPADQLDRFEASMSQARRIGVYRMSADGDPVIPFGMAPAKEHLFLAKDEAEVAKLLAAEGESRGFLLLARAQSDVDLALELAREAALRRQVRRTVGATDGSVSTQAPDHANHPGEP